MAPIDVSRRLVNKCFPGEAGVEVNDDAAHPAGSILFTGRHAGEVWERLEHAPDLGEFRIWLENTGVAPDKFEVVVYGARAAGREESEPDLYLGVVSDFYDYAAFHPLLLALQDPNLLATRVTGVIAQRTAEGTPMPRAS